VHVLPLQTELFVFIGVVQFANFPCFHSLPFVLPGSKGFMTNGCNLYKNGEMSLILAYDGQDATITTLSK
jgi:hypothetical protein